MWDAVTNQYGIATWELKVRDNVKRYFGQNCFNNNNNTHNQQLWRTILESEDASDMGTPKVKSVAQKLF